MWPSGIRGSGLRAQETESPRLHTGNGALDAYMLRGRATTTTTTTTRAESGGEAQAEVEAEVEAEAKAKAKAKAQQGLT